MVSAATDQSLWQATNFSVALDHYRAALRGLEFSAAELKTSLSEMSGPDIDALLESLNRFPSETTAVQNAAANITDQLASQSIRAFLAQNTDLPSAVFSRLPYPIDLSKVLIFNKRSKLECDMEKFGTSKEAVLAMYRAGAEDADRILASHEAQRRSLELLVGAFGKERIVYREDFEEALKTNPSLIIAAGGDNHFQYINAQLQSEVPVLSLNTDTHHSLGYLAQASADQLGEILSKLQSGNYRFEPWTRLAVKIDGRPIGSALCEVLAAESERKFMSRNTLSHSALSIPRVEQKSSGLLVVTGAGSSGWFESGTQYLFADLPPFPPTAKLGRFALTEVFQRKVGSAERALPALTYGPLREDQTLTLVSMNDSHGIIALDSGPDNEFPRGSEATVTLDERPLWVINPNLKEENAYAN